MAFLAHALSPLTLQIHYLPFDCPAPMTIEISKPVSAVAIASIQRYFREHMEYEIGSLEAGALLGFFLKEIAPVVYNQAVTDARSEEHTSELQSQR